MPTDEEIKTVFIRSYTGENWIHKNGFLNPTLKSWIDTMLNEARADTAKQMFKFFNSISQNIVTKEDWDLFIKEFNIKEKEE